MIKYQRFIEWLSPNIKCWKVPFEWSFHLRYIKYRQSTLTNSTMLRTSKLLFSCRTRKTVESKVWLKIILKKTDFKIDFTIWFQSLVCTDGQCFPIRHYSWLNRFSLDSIKRTHFWVSHISNICCTLVNLGNVFFFENDFK